MCFWLINFIGVVRKLLIKIGRPHRWAPPKSNSKLNKLLLIKFFDNYGWEKEIKIMKFSLKTLKNIYKVKSIKMGPLNRREIHRHNGLKQSIKKSMIPVSLAINSRTNIKIHSKECKNSSPSLLSKKISNHHCFKNM